MQIKIVLLLIRFLIKSGARLITLFVKKEINNLIQIIHSSCNVVGDSLIMASYSPVGKSKICLVKLYLKG